MRSWLHFLFVWAPYSFWYRVLGDDVLPLQQQQQLCYYVQAIEATPTPSGPNLDRHLGFVAKLESEAV